MNPFLSPMYLSFSQITVCTVEGGIIFDDSSITVSFGASEATSGSLAQKVKRQLGWEEDVVLLNAKRQRIVDCDACDGKCTKFIMTPGFSAC